MTREVLIQDKVAAEMVGCSRATFWHCVKDGTIPAPIRIGGLTRWPVSEITTLIKSATKARGKRSRKWRA